MRATLSGRSTRRAIAGGVILDIAIEMEVAPIDPVRLEPIVGRDRIDRLRSAAADAARVLDGRSVVNVNSTFAGGGVAEMLATLLAYARAVGVDVRWVVIRGDASFFAVTKRIHNGLSGGPGDGGELGPLERADYEGTLRANAESIAGHLGRRDVLVLHDPQTAGFDPAAAGAGGADRLALSRRA